jgi:hypothetical protein
MTKLNQQLWECSMIKSLLTRFAHPLAVTAIAATVATSAQAGTLSIGHTTWVGYGTLYLAQDLGYFKENGASFGRVVGLGVDHRRSAQVPSAILLQGCSCTG